MDLNRIVALEEHVAFPNLVRDIDPQLIARRGFPPGGPGGPGTNELLADITEKRLPSMDAAGITTQVLSVAGPGADLLPPEQGPEFARRYNDAIAEAVRAHPGRFAGFAHLPLTAPEAAANELASAVRDLGFRGALINGHTGGLFLDDPSFEPLLACAEQLSVPLYVHPGIPPEAVRRAYYDGFDEHVSYLFATAGWGWHAETAVHVMRMVLRGTLDRHPKLKLIIGHTGEGLPAMMTRFDTTLGNVVKNLQRPISETILDHVSMTTSGFFSAAPFLAALLTFGADRILFSVDYPFSENGDARKFLNELPVTPSDKQKIAHGNADRLLGLSADDAPVPAGRKPF